MSIRRWHSCWPWLRPNQGLISSYNYSCRFSKSFLISLSILLIVFISLIRVLTGPELALSLFYLLPISIVTWNIGRWAGIFISIASTLSWLVADLILLDKFSSLMIPLLNETFRLIVFIIIANTLYELKHSSKENEKLARTDSLTGISNRRAFFEFASIEINKAKRFKGPISLLYIDIDNFKNVNDTHGHHAGDCLLYSVAQTIKENIRIIDIVARFGGDEFCILMSQTDAISSYSVAKKVQQQLQSIVAANEWHVTFSMGLITYENSPKDVDNMIKDADRLMYIAKSKGKNRIEQGDDADMENS